MKMQSLKNKPLNKQAGFTLVELIIVIVILGILAVTAAPRFLDLQGDANKSTLEGVEGAISSGMNIIHGKAIIASVHKEDATTVTIDAGEDVAIVYGYPEASEAAFEAFLDVNFSPSTAPNEGDFNIDTTTDGTAIIYPNSYESDGTCIITYTEATSAIVPATVVIDTTGC